MSIEKSFPFYSICAVRPESSWPSSSPYVHLWILATDIFLVALVFDSRATVSCWFFLPLSAHSLLPSDFPAAIFIRAPVSSRFLAAGAVWPDPIFCRCLNFLVAVFGGKPAQGSQSPARPSVCLRGAHQVDDFLFCLGSQVFRVRSRFSISARLINFTRHVSIRFLSRIRSCLPLEEHTAFFDFALSSHVWIVVGPRPVLLLSYRMKSSRFPSLNCIFTVIFWMRTLGVWWNIYEDINCSSI
jgi:hypothetical protein